MSKINNKEYHQNHATSKNACTIPNTEKYSQGDISLFNQSKKIDFELNCELAIKLNEQLRKGLASTKSEIVRRALLHYFHHVDTQDQQRARLESLSTCPGGRV